MGKKLPKPSLIFKKNHSIAGILRGSLAGYKIKGYFSSILQKVILHRSIEGSHFNLSVISASITHLCFLGACLSSTFFTIVKNILISTLVR